MRSVLLLRERFPDVVVAALGIHPQLIPHLQEDAAEEAFDFLAAHLGEVDMLGEVGLDWKHATTVEEQARQTRWLERQLELAATHRKPINLHSRRALRQVMEHAIAFQERTGLAAQLHWFTQSKKLIRQTNAAGVYVSVGPATLIDPRAAETAATVDPDLLLTETDAPVPFGGDSARPAWIGRVLARLAEERGVDVDTLEAQVEANFARLLAGEAPRRQAPA
jgi:TatD family hydrolase